MASVFTRDRLWDEPVILESDDQLLRVISIRDAALCLKNHWPGQHEHSRNAALVACERVMQGMEDPQTARETFVNAAKVAGFRVNVWSEI